MGYDTVQYLMRHLPIPDQYHAVHRPSDGIESGAGLAGEGHDLLEPGGEAVAGSGYGQYIIDGGRPAQLYNRTKDKSFRAVACWSRV